MSRIDDATTNAPAGWYDDGAGSQRWWDGSAWTDKPAVIGKKAARASVKEQRQSEKEAQALAKSPIGLAISAHENGDAFFQLEIDISRLSGAASSFGLSDNRIKSSGRATDLLGEIEAIGWHLEHAGYVFVETGATTSNRIMSTGQGTVTKGFVNGIYLFRRSA